MLDVYELQKDLYTFERMEYGGTTGSGSGSDVSGVSGKQVDVTPGAGASATASPGPGRGRAMAPDGASESEGELKRRTRRDGLFRYTDALMQLLAGDGPAGFLALGGFAQKLLDAYFPDEVEKLKKMARRRMARAEHEPTDVRRLLMRQPRMDRRLDYEFFEEIRVVILFQVLIMVAAEARLRREAVLFQRFLRENRFKLMSNGINPPSDVFRTKSYASIDIPLVAVWLTSLSPDERDRFHLLKSNFSEEVAARDVAMDQEDSRAQSYAEDLLEARRGREETMAKKRHAEFELRRRRRADQGQSADVLDESWTNALELVQEVESGWSCRPGKNDRTLQFFDHEFPADGSSLGNGCSALDSVVGWRPAAAINPECVLFEGGTDPDDVMQGKLRDAWFLSALNIVAASGGVGDDDVDPLIDRLFVNKETSFVGGYAVQFYKNNQWETVVVDDYFPVLHHSYMTSDSRGAAFGYSKGFQELWVPLLEKAYAKYHGSFAAIEEGTVPMALKDLTGGEAEEIFLAAASRGANKKALWSQLRRYRSNKYLLGAGCMSAAAADRELQETGLVLGAAYVIYEVRDIDGHQLIKLRNPPGDHEEWKGDWGDSSDLWTRRLRVKLSLSEEDDNTFWMSFDDFCNCFRSLYVCRYYDPDKWVTQLRNGRWDASIKTASGIPCRHNLVCEIEKNPQWSLDVQRPTDVTITLTQVDQYGLAALQPWPAAVYIQKGSKISKAEPVRQLASNIVAHSGAPERAAEVTLYASLDPGQYTLLAATYLKDMESEFTLSVVSNYPCTLEQLFPEVAKVEREPFTLREKAEAKMKEQLKKLEERVSAARQKVEAEVKVMALGGDEDSDEDDTPPVWVKRHDKAKNQDYYYNTETEQAVWEKPEGYKEPVAKKKAEVKGDVCQLCFSDRVKGKGKRVEVVKCAGKCGVQVHEACGSFTDTNPAGPFWLCDTCRENGVVPDAPNNGV